MNPRIPIDDDEVDDIVRTYLDDIGRGVDVRKQMADILAKLSAVAPSETSPQPNAFRRRRSKARLRIFWGGTIAAGLLLGSMFVSYLILAPAPINAAAIVGSARSELWKPIDRCYRVEIDVPKGREKAIPFLDEQGEMLVWTRGERFRVVKSMDDSSLSWGRDETRRTWISTGDKGVVFEKDDVPTILRTVSQYLSFDVGKLMDLLLKHFELESGGKFEDNGTTIAVIHAHQDPKSRRGFINEARLEINLSTKSIRSLELTHLTNGVPTDRFRFTLIEEARLPDSTYRLAGNLKADGEILSAKQPADRAALLGEFHRLKSSR